MTRALLLATLTGLIGPMASLHAQDAKPEKGKTEAPSPATTDQFKQALREALERIQTLVKQAETSEGSLRLPTPDAFAMRLSRNLAAAAVIAIGQAQFKLGDKTAARATWQSAADRAAELNSFDATEEKARLFLELARAQYGAGDRDEARFNLRQAIQSARLIREESRFPFPAPAGLETRENPLYKKAAALRRIAQAQAEASEAAGALETFRAATEAADSIKNPRAKVEALVEIAAANPPGSPGAAWARALDFALTEQDDFKRAKAVATVLRARVKAKEVEGTLKTVEDRLKGDLKTYGLWVIADAIASSEIPVGDREMKQLVALVEKADFDRLTKKIKVYRRLAQAFARLGDPDQAYRMVSAPNPANNVQTFHATHGRIEVMREVARAQIKAKRFANAKDTVQAALELIAGFVDEDAESYFPLVGLGILQAQAGDLDGARRTAEMLASHEGKISILSEIAVKESEANHADRARALIQQAFEASRAVPSDEVWRSIDRVEPPVDFDARQTSLGEIAKAQAKSGSLDEALKTLREVKGTGMSWGSFMAGKVLGEIAETLLKADDVKGAIKVTEDLLTTGFSHSDAYDILHRIARRQAELGDSGGVLSWAKTLRYPDAQVHAIHGMAEGITARLTEKKVTTAASAP